ncbi:hypothetical protein LG291_14560 [Cytobacillus firmus]|uniref:hypothetical protein n=1 Tax=Cytobacillus firmus TaxID=1399 RepID=UPI003850AEBC
MAKAVIYYKMNFYEGTEQAVSRVSKWIKELQTLYTVKGVFIDLSDSSTELMELLNSRLSDIDIMFINKDINDEFDSILISELSRREHFEVRLLEWT